MFLSFFHDIKSWKKFVHHDLFDSGKNYDQKCKEIGGSALDDRTNVLLMLSGAR